ncbi:hypothetical protein BJ741DRAFT_590154 [Chytriomyces cf. hyalinus JEL632]|nr:hypothetical protein BJ741DRAFT_590154 [Chytriomyces cf. hyalinus JEL632]
MNTSKVRFNNSFSFSDASFDVSRLSLNEAPLESVETQQLKIRQQHLARLLAQTQDTVLKQQTEIAVLRKTLLDYSSSSFISTSMSQADVEPVDARAAEDERILDKVKSQEKEIANLCTSIMDSRKTIDSLKSQLCLKDATIDSLTTALDKSTQEAFVLKDQSAKLKKELDECRQGLREQANSLVNTMLTRASASPVREPTKSNRGRKQNSSRAREDTISSAQKKLTKTVSPSNIKTQFRNRGHHHAPTTGSEHQMTSPSVWKRARSYDASLRESVRHEVRSPKIPINRSKTPISGMHDKFERDDGVMGFSAPIRIDTKSEGKAGVDQLRWLDLSPFEHGELPDKKMSMHFTDWNRKNAANHNLVKPANPNTKTVHQEVEFEKLNARAATAEKERDALEEELLNLLKMFNQNKMAT